MSNWETVPKRHNAAFWLGIADAWVQLGKVECRFSRHGDAARMFAKAAFAFERAGDWYQAAWAQGQADAETAKQLADITVGAKADRS